MSIKGDLIAVGVAGAVLLAAAWYAKKKLTAAVAPYVPYVDPTNEQNVVNQAAQGFYQAVTGSKGTMGGDFYDATHGGMLSNGTFNPTSGNNAVNRTVEGWYQGLTGSKGTIGGDLYDWLH
jgi:hypothetical protein